MKPRGFLLSLLLILIFISCSGDPGAQDTAVPVTVRVYEADDAKTIGYDGSVSGVSGKINSITVSVYGQDSPGTAIAGPVSIPYSGGTEDISIGNLIPDGYTITAEGYSGTHKLTSDSWTGWISRDTSAVSIEMKTFSGKGGGISVTPDFPEGTSGSWALSWKLMGGEAFGTEAYSGSVSAAYTAGSGTSVELSAPADGFDAGRYILMMDAVSGSETLSAAEAVRLLPGLDSSGTISFGREVSGIGEEAILTVSDNTGKVIPVENGGYSVTGDSATLTLSGLSAEPTNVLVYDNGDALSGFTESYAGGTLTIGLSGLSSGVHDVTAIVLDGTASGIGSARIALRVNNPTISAVIPQIAGVAWDMTDEDPELYRLYTSAEAATAASSATGHRAAADPNSIVTVDIQTEPVPYFLGALDGSIPDDYGSPFDSIGPWQDMDLVAMADGGSVRDTIGEGETVADFVSAWGSSYDYMVHLPDAYYRIDDIDYDIDSDGTPEDVRLYYVSDKRFAGSELHPASDAYAGRYDAMNPEKYGDGEEWIADDVVYSLPSYLSDAHDNAAFRLTMQQAHDLCWNRGSGYTGLTYDILSYAQLMFIVEYATLDIQNTLGYGSSNYRTGQSDTIPYHTGHPNRKNQNGPDVSYRYLEGLLTMDYTGDTIDGMLVDDGVVYIAPTIAAADRDDYDTLTDIPSGWTELGMLPGDGIVSGLHYVESEPWAIGLPSASVEAYREIYTTDQMFTEPGIRAVRLDETVGWYHGMWYFNAAQEPGYVGADFSTRLCYRPGL